MSLDRTEVLHKRGEIGSEIKAMDAIFNTPEFQELSEKSRVLFVRQQCAMDEYFNILCQRVEEMDNPSPEIGEPVEVEVEPEMSLLGRLRAWWDS